MRSFLKTISCLVVLTLPLFFVWPVHAQQVTATSPQITNEGLSELETEHMERRELREEREKIRAEHEDLESEHDLLKTQCMNVKGQDHVTCHEKWEAWHQKMDALHERMKALHEKTESERAAWKQHAGMKPPSDTPQSPSPAGQ
jgi:uncharacterized protein (DUF3084 family)